jgi:hypothetical protein
MTISQIGYHTLSRTDGIESMELFRRDDRWIERKTMVQAPLMVLGNGDQPR